MTIGGTQQVIRQLAENMDREKFSSEIACIDGLLGEIGEILTEQGVKVHLFERQSGIDIELIKQLRALIKKNRYHLVHCHQYSPYVYGLLASLLTPAKIIFTEHGRFYPDYGTWKRKLFNPVFSLFTCQIIAISQATKDALVRYENFRQSKIHVIYNGIADMSQIEVDEIELKEQFAIPKFAFLFGTISRLQPIKNQPMMIKAFKRVHDLDENTHLLIVGDGEIREKLERLVNDLNLGAHVTFTGFQKDPYRFHKIIDVFLLTSFSEGTSMTLLEAMSFSTPSIVTNVGGNLELVIDGVGGLIVPSEGTCELFEACISFIGNNKLGKKMGIESRSRYEESFSVDRMVKKVEAVYKSLAS
jgi:glycosyltransferase involved in cell wall biosynthesis